jgi:hypothetical protein
MTDEEMQKLQNQVVESIEEYFESYDWDQAWQRHMEGK